MKLSSRAKHGVRLAIEVARRGSRDKPVSLSEVARVTGLSDKFLEQLALSLRSHSLIRGVSGRKGGYLLTRPAREITVGEVLRAVIGPIDITDCAEDPPICMSAEFCECRLLWVLLRDKLNNLLDAYTLADLISEDWVEFVRKEIRKEQQSEVA
jgi:Rrf2 family protein